MEWISKQEKLRCQYISHTTPSEITKLKRRFLLFPTKVNGKIKWLTVVTAKYEIKSNYCDCIRTASDHRRYQWKYVGWDGEEAACVDPHAYNDYEIDYYNDDDDEDDELWNG